MVRPKKADNLRMDFDLRIPVTHEQKMLIAEAAGNAQMDMATWARGILVKEAKKETKAKD